MKRIVQGLLILVVGLSLAVPSLVSASSMNAVTAGAVSNRSSLKSDVCYQT